MKELRKNQKEAGITLVALIITIIILIILAAVAIQALYKENFINVAMRGTENYAEEQYREKEMLEDLDNRLSEAISNIENTKASTSIYARLYTKNDSKDEVFKDEVLMLASKEDTFLDSYDNLTLKEDFGDISSIVKLEKPSDLPMYEEIINSKEFKELMELNPEEAKKKLEDLLELYNKENPNLTPWLYMSR